MSKEPYKILIVDDERLNLYTLVELLAPNYTTVIAKTGEQALKRAFSAVPPDLILLDIVMPGMDGYEVCKKLKADPRTENIPVIFITVMSGEQNEYKGLRLGAIDYITKPFSPDIVTARIRNHLELKRRGDLLARMSFLDGLTGIANRRHFDKFFQHEWMCGLRADSKLSLVMMDIDHFKQFNDRYGHLAGDACLQRVAKTIDDTLQRTTDLAARYGGEEFAAVLPMTEEKGAFDTAEKIRKKIMALAIPHDYVSAAGSVTLSLGVATMVPVQEKNPADLINAADKALFSAKANGRNRVMQHFIPQLP